MNPEAGLGMMIHLEFFARKLTSGSWTCSCFRKFWAGGWNRLASELITTYLPSGWNSAWSPHGPG